MQSDFASSLPLLSTEYFRETFAVLNEAAGGLPDRAKLAEIMRRHGLRPVALPA